MKWALLTFSILTLITAFMSSIVATPTNVSAAGNTCVYVFGTIAGRTVTTPALLITVPEGEIAVDPIRVHVDETKHSILGYSLNTPEQNAEVDGRGLYVPGVSEEVPSYSVTLEDLDIDQYHCVSFGATTPAIPVYVPESVFDVPGVAAVAPAIHVNILGQQHSVGGRVIDFEGKTIVIPGVDTEVPSQTVETPDQTVVVDLNDVTMTALYMLPR